MSQQETCFRELLERNHTRWQGIARCYANTGDRDDLVQEIMMQVWKNLDRFESRSSIDTWAYRVALNTALAWDRTAKNRAKKLSTDATDVSRLPGDAHDDSREQRVLDEFLASLSKADRAVMLLFLDDVPNPEAAEITGISEGALRVRLHRIRNKFEQMYCEGEVSDEV